MTSSGYDADVDSLFHKLSWKDLQFQHQIQKALINGFQVFKWSGSRISHFKSCNAKWIKLCSEGLG